MAAPPDVDEVHHSSIDGGQLEIEHTSQPRAVEQQVVWREVSVQEDPGDAGMPSCWQVSRVHQVSPFHAGSPTGRAAGQPRCRTRRRASARQVVARANSSSDCQAAGWWALSTKVRPSRRTSQLRLARPPRALSTDSPRSSQTVLGGNTRPSPHESTPQSRADAADAGSESRAGRPIFEAGSRTPVAGNSRTLGRDGPDSGG